MKKPYVVGVDVGGQTAKFGIVDASGNVLKQSVVVSNTQSTAEEFVRDLSNALMQLIDGDYNINDIQGIGVGAPNANYYTGCINIAPNLTWCKTHKVEFAKLLSEAMNGLPVTLTNDANAAAMGEMTYGVARGMNDFIMITLGTGVGSGIVINGKVVYGHDGNAGELGHVCSMRNNGRVCGCGKTGCLEAYTSATGVARTARELLELSEDVSLLREIPLEEITSKDVFDAAVQGDQLAKDIFEFTGRILGESLADFSAFSSPEAIVLFGGLTKSGRLIYEPIMENLNLNLMPQWRNKIKVLFSTLKESDAAILGASALAWVDKDTELINE